MNSNQPNRNRKGMGAGLPFSFWYVLVAIGFLLVIQNVLFPDRLNNSLIVTSRRPCARTALRTCKLVPTPFVVLYVLTRGKRHLPSVL